MRRGRGRAAPGGVGAAGGSGGRVGGGPAVFQARGAVPGGCLSRGSAGAPSEVEHPGRAFADQAGALHVAAHRAQVAVPGVAHDVLVAHAFAVGLGDEADAQRMRAEPSKPST